MLNLCCFWILLTGLALSLIILVLDGRAHATRLQIMLCKEGKEEIQLGLISNEIWIVEVEKRGEESSFF